MPLQIYPMLKSNYIYLIAIFTLISCSAIDTKESEISTENIFKVDTLNPKVDELDSLKVEQTFEDPIDIIELKGLSFLTVTSGVLSHSESKTFCKPLDHDFFGHYHLIDKSDDKFEVIGQLIVSVPKSAENWTFENDYETFVEIKLENNKVRLWEDLGVGAKAAYLENFIGDNFYYQKGTMVYAELGEYSLDATILGDTINKLTVGKYCK